MATADMSEHKRRMLAIVDEELGRQAADRVRRVYDLRGRTERHREAEDLRRRVKMMHLGELQFMEMLKECLGGSRRRTRITGMPEGAEIVDWWLSPEYRGFGVCIRHESFPLLAPGCMLEVIVPVVEVLDEAVEARTADYFWEGDGS